MLVRQATEQYRLPVRQSYRVRCAEHAIQTETGRSMVR